MLGTESGVKLRFSINLRRNDWIGLKRSRLIGATLQFHAVLKKYATFIYAFLNVKVFDNSVIYTPQAIVKKQSIAWQALVAD